jgi:hypothetical protein
MMRSASLSRRQPQASGTSSVTENAVGTRARSARQPDLLDTPPYEPSSLHIAATLRAPRRTPTLPPSAINMSAWRPSLLEDRGLDSVGDHTTQVEPLLEQAEPNCIPVDHGDVIEPRDETFGNALTDPTCSRRDDVQ